MPRHGCLILRELVINTLPSYTSIWNAAVGNLNCKLCYRQLRLKYLCNIARYSRVEMWWHTRRNQISSFGRNGRVRLNRPGEVGSVHSSTGSRGVRISGSNPAYTMFRGSVNGPGYPLHSPISPSLPPCVPPHFPLHPPSLPPLASQCADTFQLDSTNYEFPESDTIVSKRVGVW